MESSKPEIKEGYKLTDVGIIPEDWKVAKLGDIFDFKNGLNKEKKYFGEGTPIVNYMDVYKNRALRAKDLKGKVIVSNAEAKNYDVRKEDVFFTRTSETVEEIGMSSVVIEHLRDTVFSGFVLRARPKNNWLDTLYKKYCFSSEAVRKEITSRSSYTTRALTNGRLLSEVQIPRPPLPEQQSIAEILCDVDALVTSLEQLITKKGNIKQGTMQLLLTGKKRLTGFSGEWTQNRLSNFLEMPVTYGVVTAGGFHNVGVLMVRGGDIKQGRINTEGVPLITAEKNKEYSRTILKKDDVVIALVGYPGEAAVVSEYFEGANISRAVGLIRTTTKVDSTFLVQLLNSPMGRKIVLAPSAGSAQVVVNLHEMNKLLLFIPTIEEQKAIAQILSDMDAEIEALEKKREKYKSIKQGLMQELLTGRTRLT